MLGDTPARDYGDKLEAFSRFAEPELRALIGELGIAPGMRVLDAGCGVGLVTAWLGDAVGLDLALAHARAARERVADVVVGDIARLPLRDAVFDLVWCANTIHHLPDPLAGVRELLRVLRPGGRVALVQSFLLPEMVFAWDERLEREVIAANRRYYREKYGLSERDVTGMRTLVGLLRRAGVADVRARSVLIERIAPLSAADERYFVETVFAGYWGRRVQPYLTAEDWAEVQRLCDPEAPEYALRRPDFHYLQSLSMVVGERT